MPPQSQLLYQSDLLNQNARELSHRHTFSHQKKDIIPIKPLLIDAKEGLTKAYRTLVTSVKQNQDISPAADWLIDNFYVIQEQIIQIENDFPIEYQRTVPHLTSGPNQGMPRVYDLVQSLVLHTDNIVDLQNLTLYIQSYQEELTLNMGELWAIPIMVRLVLVQQLAEKASQILERRKIRVEIQEFVDRLLKEEVDEPGWVLHRVIDWMKTHRQSFEEQTLLVELAHQLQVAGLISEDEKRWFEYRLQPLGVSLVEALREESQRRSELQVSIQNGVISLREISETEWQEFIEECSIVDQMLRLDPMGIYPEMDHEAKDQYRRAVERLSKYSDYSETEIAEKVLSLAERNINHTGNETAILHNHAVLKKHVGYYLVGGGYEELTQNIKYKMPIGEQLRKKLEKTAGYYIGIIAALCIALLGVLWIATDAISFSWPVAVSVLLVAFFPALELSVTAVNRLFAFTLPPRRLPKLKIDNRIPDKARTMVVVPTLLSSPDDVKRQLEKLEITALANPDPGLQFVLLSDFTDADQEQMPDDAAILNEAKHIIEELNKKYTSRYGQKFFLLHRCRKWNPKERVWMGWERKRGKLEKLNELLCDPSADHSFSTIYGDFISSIQSMPVQFILTLDADTRTPPDSVIDLVRVASHPLNRAWYDKNKGRITKGYGIIQPRISIPPDTAQKTYFTRIFSGNVGIDIYTTAVSDIYQDMMGEAVFTGKGIYDVRAFHTVLDNRFPENRILSHDLIESNYVRAALSTDIELFDDYPTSYASYCKRNHRWTRGDWQIASWLFGDVPAADGTAKNPLHLLARWKIFDNLRRSLTPLFLTIFFVAGWFWLPGTALLWTAAAFGILAFPIYVSFSTDVLNRPARIKWKLYFEKVRSNLKINTFQAISTLAILPHQAVIHLDAIFRVIWRLLISKKHLLEWTSASRAEALSSNTVYEYIRLMGISVLLGIAVLITALLIDPGSLWIVVPFSLLWISSPGFAWYFSHPHPHLSSKNGLSGDDKSKLRRYARRTWFYFERLVNEEYSWLPPDYYQEDPLLPPVARTSPTNIGLTLVATQAAYEMGYITLSELLSRLERTLNSLMQLDRYNGHFYNWYDIRLGEVLNPKYVSTVDSGNLAAGLIVVKQAVGQLLRQENPNAAFWKGLEDTLETVHAIFSDLEPQGNENGYEDVCRQIKTSISRMLNKLNGRESPATISESIRLLNELKESACTLCGNNLMKFRSSLGDARVDDLLFWLESPLRQVESYKKELSGYTYSTADDSGLEVPPAKRLEKLEQSKDSEEYRMLKQWTRQVHSITSICEQLVAEMDFRFIYNKKKGLFNIGYNVEKAELDKGTYDLLASEARIASIVAIAKGDVPSEHWFRLSRRLTSRNNDEFLLSWGGTTFEYLMPLLFMRSYPYTLLSHTYARIVEWQREYSQKFDRPWGFSESAYNILNIDLNYQYRAFGAPGLGLKRGLAEEFVVAPYASALALMVDPKDALDNLEVLKDIGGLGLRGYYDAIDFTPDHLPELEPYRVVKTYMAHHHGMSLIAFLNVLNGWTIHNYFHADPQIKACELLLQERIPRGIPIKEPHPIDVEMEPGEQHSMHYVVEHAGINNLDDAPPRVHLLSNGQYHTFVSHSGTGSSYYNDIMLTGWKADPTEDPLGLFVYIKDRETGEYWSAFHQPVKRKPDRYDSWFHNGKVQTSRVDEWLETTTEICVSPEHPIELRKITLTNYSDRRRTLELTSYAEVVLNQAQHHNAHPAFSKLFVQTDYLAEHHGLIAWRRPRMDSEQPKFMVHTVASYDLENLTEPLQFETERSNFIGRGRSLLNPQAMQEGYRLSGSIGNVSDPVMSLRRVVNLKAGEKIQVTYGIGWAGSRKEAVELVDRFDNPYAVDRAFDLSSIYNTVELDHIGISSERFQYFQKLASYMLYNDSHLRSSAEILSQNYLKQSNLWTYGISGDHPVIVFRIDKSEQLKSVERMLKGHLLWKQRGLQTDLVILNDHMSGYVDELQQGLQQTVESSYSRYQGHENDNVFVLRSDRLPEDDLVLILTVASVVLEGSLPKIDDLIQKQKVDSFHKGVDAVTYSRASIAESTVTDIMDSKTELQFFNGYGGFSKEDNEYRILLKPDPDRGLHQLPPAPWINIIANPSFGFIATETGAGYTWSENSRENKLSSWSNDPTLDPHSEAFYIRDEERQTYWSPTAGPVPGHGRYEVSHGFGYTRHRHTSYGIESELLQFVPREDPVKISKLSICNKSSKKRHLSLFSYQAWVLGINREASARYIVQEANQEGDTIYARNHYNNEFAGRMAFSSFLPVPRSSPHYVEEKGLAFTTDREKFIGRNCSLKRPRAVAEQTQLDNEVKIGGDPCAAFQLTITLEPEEKIECIALMGEGDTAKEAEQLAQRYRDHQQVEKAFEEVREFWTHSLGRIDIQTPDPALNLMMNGWLLYQTIACRMWSRAAFYQAGGAYGFRDQLQDAMAALYVDPQMTRDQILLHASRQFIKGDVQHWWHPPTGRGVRTKISDDRLWLPYVTAFYIESTGDEAILDETISYLEARKLADHEHEAYLQPSRRPLSGLSDTNISGSLYEHCIKAIDITLKMGAHGLPLIGAGDWNDGMNRVGHEGQGESVWLGFFMYSILQTFIPYCKQMGDEERAERYQKSAHKLAKHLNQEGWDGNWYIRAFYDNGTPLGSAQNNECRIDAVAQAWSVISGAAPEEKKRKALAALEEYLISEQDGLIRLLTPPFDQTKRNPGYIKGYIPGVRENGGQYTHAALWTVRAFAEMGSGEKAVKYLRMINPINHAREQKAADLYKVEPYVVAGDVYGEPPHVGQGGWSWYTGSAGWMYRVALESILGIRLKGNTMTIQPVISPEWEDYSIRWKSEDGRTVYDVEVQNPNGLESGGLEGTIDEQLVSFPEGVAKVKLKNDNQNHSVVLQLVDKQHD
ncbi:GH36-type glycosyl hydrolase domain-containing protein [Fodinibius salsisoli]|uniref:Glycosyltransferase 36 n=1 Tax=Fodinibius salsisoli TaxID=2820877 RepID=A0ABT3PKY2_9BACT|nr:glucoamylase family protein [Fodinibius salsisoli]MCW9705879.1 glycosyltransferase 36 [Fodinibius salsisoli]